jgi:hypothetical protein
MLSVGSTYGYPTVAPWRGQVRTWLRLMLIEACQAATDPMTQDCSPVMPNGSNR